MKLLRHIIIVCLLATFSASAGEQITAKAKGAVTPPTAAEPQLLQGTWEGGEGDGKITITITGDSLHFHRDTNFWFETTITLPPGKDPKQFHATIKDCPPSQASSMGKVVGAIFKIEDGTLTIVASGSLEEMPKSFEASENQGLSRFELRKVQPQKKNTELPKSMRGSGLGSLVLEGHELHASLKTRHLDDSDRRHHVPRALLPGNPHVSTNAAFVEAIATCASQGTLGREGVRSALYALYLGKKELGFYGLEAESAAEADRWEGAIRKVLSHNVRLGMMRVHRQGLVLVVVWRDWPSEESPECWEAVNAKVVERLAEDKKALKTDKAVEPIRVSGSGLGSLVLEGYEFHASLKTRHLDDSDRTRHVPRTLLPANPHHSSDADFVEAISRGASQGNLGSEGIRSALSALYLSQNELGFYGLEATSEEGANRREEAVRKIWSHMQKLGRAQVHREGLVIVVVWHDGVSPECWKAVNAKVVERLRAP